MAYNGMQIKTTGGRVGSTNRPPDPTPELPGVRLMTHSIIPSHPVFTKWCPRCRREVPRAEFNSCVGRYDGIDSICKSCSAKKKRDARARLRQSINACECYYCGVRLDPSNHTVDHIIPRAKGGTDDPSNVVGCCRSCNFSKKDMSVEEWRAVKERQRDGSPWFSPPQIAFLRSHGIEIPRGDRYVFWFERGAR
jgi:5-methylcytosine-specific restriction endonuclease McrA